MASTAIMLGWQATNAAMGAMGALTLAVQAQGRNQAIFRRRIPTHANT
jgi:hypothetical protein